MKEIFIWLTASVIFSIMLSGCDLKEKYERQVEMPLSINEGKKLVVHTEVGSINVCDSNTGQSSIKAKITGRADTVENAKKIAENINITVENKDDNVIINISKLAEIKSDWYSTELNIEVPAAINLDCKTSVGSVNISNITGDISAHCDVGSVSCENARGKVKLESNVGDVRLVYAQDANADVDADLSTDVGSIHFKGPKEINAKFDGKADVGSINSKLPVTIEEKFCKKSLSGTIGQGRGNVIMKTDVGSINIE